MPSKIALSVALVAAAMGAVSAYPHATHSTTVVNGGHNVYSDNENKLIDLSDLDLNADILDLVKRTDYSACKKYVSSYNGGHNVYSVNENKLIDASGATVDLNLLSSNGRKQKSWHKVPSKCITYIKSVNGGHNVVVDNENKLIDLSDLTANLNLLSKRHYDGEEDNFFYYNGGHNVESTNENKLLDASDLTANIDILSKRKAPSYSVYNGGHNVESTNENKLVDLSDLLANVNILSRRKAPATSTFTSYNGGHNVESDNENKLIDLSDLTALVNVLSKRHEEPSTKFTSYNGGHNVESTNENKLIDLSDLTALVNVLSKRSTTAYAPSVHARDIMEDVYRRSNSDEDCTCVKKPTKPSPPKPHQDKPTKPSTTPSEPVDSCDGDKPAPPAPATATSSTPAPSPTDKSHKHHHHHTTSSSSSSSSTSSTPAPHQDKPTHKHTPKPEPTPTTTSSDDKPAPTPSKPGKVTCSSSQVYVDQGHNVVSTNENKLVDLSNLTLNINILSGLTGKKETKQVKGDSTCESAQGCCVDSSDYYYNGGHNVESTNENKGVDLSGLNLGLNILK